MSDDELRAWAEGVLIPGCVREKVMALLRVKAEVVSHHAQRADDRCWMDDVDLYVAAGLTQPDIRVGDKAAMLKNCERFLETRCAGGGPWKSYAELEKERDELLKDRDEWREEGLAALRTIGRLLPKPSRGPTVADLGGGEK